MFLLKAQTKHRIALSKTWGLQSRWSVYYLCKWQEVITRPHQTERFPDRWAYDIKVFSTRYAATWQLTADKQTSICICYLPNLFICFFRPDFHYDEICGQKKNQGKPTTSISLIGWVLVSAHNFPLCPDYSVCVWGRVDKRCSGLKGRESFSIVASLYCAQWCQWNAFSP